MIFKKVDKDKPKTIRKVFLATPMEVLALQNFFEEMSEKGYLLTGNYGAFYEFIESEPKKRRFQVDFFKKASMFDSRPEADTQEYIEYCKSAGWTHILGVGKMQCFYTEDMEAPGIETDDTFKLESITKAELANRIPTLILSLFYTYLGMGTLKDIMNHYSMWARFISSPLSIGLFLFLGFFIVGGLFGFVRFMAFYIKSKKRLSRGEPLELYTLEQVKRHKNLRGLGFGILGLPLLFTTLQSGSTFLMIIAPIVMIIFINIILSRFMKTRHSNRRTNIIMILALTYVVLIINFGRIVISSNFNGDHSIVASDGTIIHYSSEPVPVTLKQMGYEVRGEGVVYEETYAEESKSFMAKNRNYYAGIYNENDYGRIMEIGREYPFYDISVFESEVSWVTNRYQTLLMNQIEQSPSIEDSYPLLIEEGYKVKMVGWETEEDKIIRLVLLKDAKSILITSHEPLSLENILLILEKI